MSLIMGKRRLIRFAYSKLKVNVRGRGQGLVIVKSSPNLMFTNIHAQIHHGPLGPWESTCIIF